MNTRDSFAAWWRETHPANEEQRIQAMRERISRETGVPAELLTGDTEDSCRAYADQLSAHIQQTRQLAAAKAELAQLKAETAARDVREMKERISRETGVPAELLAGDTEDSCRAYAAQLRAYAGPTYPSLSGGSVDPSTRGQDSRSARDKFSDWVAGQWSYNPFRRSGGGDTWHI